jgi:chemotaxis protein MotB
VKQISLPIRLAIAVLVPGMLLGGCAWQSDLDAARAENAQLQQQLAARTSELKASQTHAAQLGGAILYTLNTDLAFAPGSWELTARGKDLIGDLAKKLAATQQQKLVVTGYTDNTPVGAGLIAAGVTSNQILSEKRAGAVVDYMTSQGVRPDMLSAVGMGDQNPVAPNTSAANRAKNRRVEISAM